MMTSHANRPPEQKHPDEDMATPHATSCSGLGTAVEITTVAGAGLAPGLPMAGHQRPEKLDFALIET